MISCIHQITIQQEIDQVGRYLQQVRNLPAWTRFFREVGDAVDGRYQVQTVLGPIQTWIETQIEPSQQTYWICSIIRGAEERAQLTLTPAAGTQVQFTVWLPDHAPAEQVARQQSVLLQELELLKQIMESQAVRNSATTE